MIKYSFNYKDLFIYGNPFFLKVSGDIYTHSDLRFIIKLITLYLIMSDELDYYEKVCDKFYYVYWINRYYKILKAYDTVTKVKICLIEKEVLDFNIKDLKVGQIIKYR